MDLKAALSKAKTTTDLQALLDAEREAEAQAQADLTTADEELREARIAEALGEGSATATAAKQAEAAKQLEQTRIRVLALERKVAESEQADAAAARDKLRRELKSYTGDLAAWQRQAGEAWAAMEQARLGMVALGERRHTLEARLADDPEAQAQLALVVWPVGTAQEAEAATAGLHQLTQAFRRAGEAAFHTWAAQQTA